MFYPNVYTRMIALNGVFYLKCPIGAAQSLATLLLTSDFTHTAGTVVCSFPGQRNDKYPDKNETENEGDNCDTKVHPVTDYGHASVFAVRTLGNARHRLFFDQIWIAQESPVYGDGLVDGRRWDRRRNEKGMIVWGHEHRASRWSLLKLAVWCVLWCLICWCWSIWIRRKLL